MPPGRTTPAHVDPGLPMRSWAPAWLRCHLSLTVCSWRVITYVPSAAPRSREEPHLSFVAGGIELKTKHHRGVPHPHRLGRTQAQDGAQPHRPTWLRGDMPVGQAQGVLPVRGGWQRAVPGPSSGRQGCWSLRLLTRNPLNWSPKQGCRPRGTQGTGEQRTCGPWGGGGSLGLEFRMLPREGFATKES